MATKRTSKDAEESATDIHRHVGDDIGNLIERGNAGEKFALVELYGRASAWARGGSRPIPEPLGTWIADRLLDVARAIDARKESDVGRIAGAARGGGREIGPALAVALKVQRAGAKGRAPNPKTAMLSQMLAREVLHFMTWENLLPEQAIRRVVEYNASKNMPVPAGEKSYSAAWQAHGADLMREVGVSFADPKKRK